MIKVICVGKIKELFSHLVKEYEKRLLKYTKFELIEIPDSSTDDPVVCKRQEKEKILKVISEKDYIITLEIEGRMYNSNEFAHLIEQTLIHHPQITFIIGGSYGLDEEIKKLAKMSLSFSPLTFPHQLFRVLLLEQIYRAYTIMNHEKYHK